MVHKLNIITLIPFIYPTKDTRIIIDTSHYKTTHLHFNSKIFI